MDERRAFPAFFKKPRTIDNIGLIVRDWLYERRNVTRVVFKVRVLHHDVATIGDRKAATQRGTLALIRLLEHHLEFGKLLVQPCEKSTGAIGTSIVHRDNLNRQRKRKQAGDHTVDRPHLIVDRYDDAQQKVGWQGKSQLLHTIVGEFLLQRIELVERRISACDELVVADGCFPCRLLGGCRVQLAMRCLGIKSHNGFVGLRDVVRCGTQPYDQR